MDQPNPQAIQDFIDRWRDPDGSERSNFQSFANDLCTLIGVETPASSGKDNDEYGFERRVKVRRLEGRGPTNFIDLYRRGSFVLEAKQSRKRQHLSPQMAVQYELEGTAGKPGTSTGRGWDMLMQNARMQAENYAKLLPEEEGWPPFLIVVDVGTVIEVYADFSLQGKHYAQFPDRQNYRIRLDDLRKPEIRDRLHRIWQDPLSLNPAKRTAEVTREVADLLAKLSKALETRLIRALPQKEQPEALADKRRGIAENVAMFLMRCLFTMFAEDVGLLPRNGFTELLRSYIGQADKLHFQLERLWADMNKGGFSTDLRQELKRFNGGLFKSAEALRITEDDLSLLIMAAERDWKDVEPAIFGTLLEQALDPQERHRLGAHYTPRAYVERLVTATIIDPLSEDWDNVRTAAAQLAKSGKLDEARSEVRDFHQSLCGIRVLDPACGTGNFLYVALELMKRLEGEVLELLADLGEDQYILELDRHTIDPHQFLGLELNPRATAIAELVLWIGYLQWHFRTRGNSMPAEPVLRNFANIKNQDAIIAYDKWDVLRDETGRPISRWDGVTHKLHPITGEEIPDEAARVEMLTYLNPRAASWPAAEFIVGNPPFIGGKDMRQELGDGYAEACWKVRPHVPGGADFVTHFWDKAAETVRTGKARRFGLITTNSITQKFSRAVIERHLTQKKPLSLLMAIPDHPWQKSADKAAVRIAMTVGIAGSQDGLLQKVVEESALNTDAPKVLLTQERGKIHADFKIGVDLGSCKPLRANENLSSRGVALHGAGFIVTPGEAVSLGLGKRAGLDRHILEYRNGRDLADRPRGVKVIDLFPLAIDDVQARFPEVYQWVADRVKPERDQNNRAVYRDKWWIFGEPRRDFRPVLKDLPRYIATVETSKHQFFQFLDASIRPDNKLVNIGVEDAFFLSVLSSRFHVCWSLAAGGRLGVGNDPVYVKTSCFDPFPFPDPPDSLKAEIRELGERLDAHRKARLAVHGHLTMTKMYNTLEKLRAGEVLSEADKDLYEAGLIGVLRDIHDRIDRAVAAAYGWPADLSEAEILERLVALNQARAAEERAGQVRWLRPDFQAPGEAAYRPAEQFEADLVLVDAVEKKRKLPPRLPDQIAAIRAILATETDPIAIPALARRFAQGRRIEGRIEDLLETLTLLGQAEAVENGFVLKG